MLNKIKMAVAGAVAALLLAAGPMVAVASANGSVDWTGQGVSDGKFNTEQCKGDTPNPGDVLWILTAAGAGSATITINGQTSAMTQQGQGSGSFHFVQHGFNGDFDSLDVTANWTGDANSQNVQLVISHGCPGTTNVTPPAPSPTPTPQVEGAVTETPTGGVNAGAGGASAFSLGSL